MIDDVLMGNQQGLGFHSFLLPPCASQGRTQAKSEIVIDGNWHGVPVLPRSHRVLEAPLRRLAPAAFCVAWHVCPGHDMKVGAVSRDRTGIP